MSQNEVLSIIMKRPGILQTEINNSESLRGLRKKGYIDRKKEGNTWSLFPTPAGISYMEGEAI